MGQNSVIRGLRVSCTIRIVKFMLKGRNQLRDKNWSKYNFCFWCEDTVAYDCSTSVNVSKKSQKPCDCLHPMTYFALFFHDQHMFVFSNLMFSISAEQRGFCCFKTVGSKKGFTLGFKKFTQAILMMMFLYLYLSQPP